MVARDSGGYTCFCAIDPTGREEYVGVIHSILRPGGMLLACFYPVRAGADSPPFPVSRTEIDLVLSPLFRVVDSRPPAGSAERRRGQEWLVLASTSIDPPRRRRSVLAAAAPPARR